MERPDRPLLQVQRQRGAEAVQAAYAEMLAGHADPARGQVLSFN